MRRLAAQRHHHPAAGHESCRLTCVLRDYAGWDLRIVKRRERAFNITGLPWIVEWTFAWLGRNCRFSKGYEYKVQTPEALVAIAATRLMLDRLAAA